MKVWLGVKVWLEVEVELAEVLAERLGAGLMEAQVVLKVEPAELRLCQSLKSGSQWIWLV